MLLQGVVQKTKCLLAPKAWLLYRVALVAGQQTQGADKYMSDVYEMLGMTMSTRQQTFWSQRQKSEQMMLNTRKTPQGNANEAKQSIVHDSKQ